MRLDQYLAQNNYCETRSKAAQLIRSNGVSINGKVITNKGYDVKDGDEVVVVNSDVLKFVSRGGHKLEKAIDTFGLDFKDKVICDIGSSTGGFTDCALQHGAKKVYALDVGTTQLHDSLRNNEKVVVMENTNFRNVTPDVFKEAIDFYVCDVSFISIREIINTLLSFKKDFHIILLFKPQFEVGPLRLNDKGVVKKPEFLVKALDEFKSYLIEKKLALLHYDYSPILGNKEGNIEFLFDIATKGDFVMFDSQTLVDEAEIKLK